MWNESIKVLTKEDNYQISRWDQLKLDLGETSIEEIAEKYRYSKVTPRQHVLNVLLAGLTIYCLFWGAMAVRSTGTMAAVIALLPVGYLVWWNNTEDENVRKG